MGIVFFCQSCGSRFEVDPRSAGKKGRCRKCGQLTEVPRAEQIASMMAIPALAGAPVRAGNGATRAAPAAGGESIGGWLRNAASSVGLASITLDRAPAGLRRGSAPSPLDDAEDSKPYALADFRPDSRPLGKAAGQAARVWRREVGGVQKLFRRLNEGAYLISIPFLMIFIVGTAVKSHATALFGATFVVLLNIGRIVAGVGNLMAVPLREGIHAGKKVKKPLWRVIEPVLTIGVVLLAFTFIPWLSRGREGDLAGRLKGTAAELKTDMRGELKKTVEGARNLDPGAIGSQVRDGLKTIGTGPDGPAPASGDRP